MTSHRTILYYSALPGEAHAARPAHARSLASLAGISLALRALADLCGRPIAAAGLRFAPHAKPHLPGGPDFSISHAGPWVGAVATARGCIGLDIETDAADRLTLRRVCDEVELAAVQAEGAAAMWVAKEAALKAWGRSVRQAPEVRVRGATASLDGEALHLARVEGLAGVRVCIASTEPLGVLEIHLLALDALVFGLDAQLADPRQCAPQRPARDPRTA